MADFKPIRWIGRSLEDLRSFPAEVRRGLGYALHFAQAGTKHPAAKPMKGFGGAGVLEIVDDHRGDTYRAVYTVRFSEAVYVLHAFEKKSRKGISTPTREMDIVRQRLRHAEQEHEQFNQSGGMHKP